MEQKSILIIHNDDQISRGMHEILSRFNFKLIYAKDGLHGLHAASFYKPDLIIADINIAVLNGLELCRMLRKEKATQGVSIIFLHNELNIDHIKVAKSLDARAFLVKPYLDNSLIYTIKRSLGTQYLQANKQSTTAKYEQCTTERLATVKYA